MVTDTKTRAEIARLYKIGAWNALQLLALHNLERAENAEHEANERGRRLDAIEKRIDRMQTKVTRLLENLGEGP